MRKIGFLVVVLSLAVLAAQTAAQTNSTPVVSNVIASQRGDGSKLVDIRYDLADAEGDVCTVWLAVQNNADDSWRIAVLTVSGHVGAGQTPGTNKQIVWDAGGDIPGWTGSIKVRVFADDGQSADGLIMITGGEFAMGDHFNEGHADGRELPVHDVYIDVFMIGRFEVTNKQYCAFLNHAISQNQIEVTSGTVYALDGIDPYFETYETESDSSISYNGSVFQVISRENHPVVMVSWFGAAAYCNWRSQQDGYESCYNLSTWDCDFTKQGYRLPTEAEWEFAARGGLTGKRYPWGDSIVTSQANYNNTGDPYETEAYPWTTPVGFFDGSIRQKSQFNWPGSATSYQTSNGVNGYGLYNMAGNVREWCNDRWDVDYYKTNPYSNPVGPISGNARVVRGGNWYDNETYCRVAYRSSNSPSYRNYHLGFRLILDFH
ncbi:MAG: formylglycine-generating enzyme family protein [Planctomycetes bacterium]|nr:formylglycine-generating enzyme family protein [Planctomycetota bacterium]